LVLGHAKKALNVCGCPHCEEAFAREPDRLVARLEKRRDPRIRHHLPTLRNGTIGNHADGCLPVFLRVHRLRHAAAPESGRLLRVLLVRLGAVPADAGRARGRYDGLVLLSGLNHGGHARRKRGAREFLPRAVLLSDCLLSGKACALLGVSIGSAARRTSE